MLSQKNIKDYKHNQGKKQKEMKKKEKRIMRIFLDNYLHSKNSREFVKCNFNLVDQIFMDGNI